MAKINKIFRVFIITSIIFSLALTSSASFIDELSRQISQRESERQELELAAQKYQKLIIETQKRIRSLKTEIQLMEAQIKKLELEIEITEGKIDQVILEILKLEYEIEETKKNIIHQRQVLAETIRAIYEYDQKDLLLLFLEDGSISSFYSQIVWLESLQEKVGEILEELKALKKDLEKCRLAEVAKKEYLEDLKENLEKNKTSLKYKTYLYEALVKKTQGKEKTFQQILAKVETQKNDLLGDINSLMQQKEKELARLKELQEKPKTGLASTAWYFSQDDPRWGASTIGISNSSLARWGCAVTSVAMVLKYHGINITPGQLAKESIYSWDLIVWYSKTWKWKGIKCMNCLLSEDRQYYYVPHIASGINWIRVDKELKAGYPVIVFVKAKGKGGKGHYVVIHHKDNTGRYVVHDPMFGPNIYLDSTRAYISELYDTTTKVDQMVIYH